MIGHMRHGSPPRLLVLQSILSPNRRESLPTPSAGVRITDEAPEEKGDLFTMSVLISRRQRGAQMRQHLVKRGTGARGLISFDRRRNRLLGVLQEPSESNNRLSRR